MKTAILYTCEKCGKIFTTEVECRKHESFDHSNNWLLSTVEAITRKTIREKNLKDSIQTTEQYIYNIIMPNIINIAKNGGNEYIFCISELNHCLDSRLAESFKFDIEVCDSYMLGKGFFTSIIEHKNILGYEYYCIQWNNHIKN